ncbi:MAG: S8 family serine peptidase [Acidimicrobiales bacterium]
MVVEGAAGAVSAAVEAVGGEVTGGAPALVEAAVPVGQLRALGKANGVARVRAPNWFQPAVVSEAVLGTNAAAWHTAGADGTGLEVAIVDGGFAGYVDKLGTELPAGVNVETTSFCPAGGMGESDHGTAVAELVHDMAPGAKLHLICLDTDADMAGAGETIVSQGIRIANMSGGFLLTGRGDGSGDGLTPAGVVRSTRLQGVLWTVSSGNLGNNHLDVVSTDRDGDLEMEFDGGAASPSFIDESEFQTFAVAGGGGMGTISLKWDAWPLTTQDYDLFLWDLSANPPVEIAASTIEQSPAGFAPVEEATVTNTTGSTRLYGAEIFRFDGSGTPRFDLFLSGDADFATGGGRTTTTASTTEPASSPFAMAVGAACHTTGALEVYSGQGPTIDGRIKPDITGPDGVSSSIFGNGSACTGDSGFYGTSASAPHVAGAAAVYLAANPALDIAELQRLLEVRAADAGAAGRDPAFGAGNLALRDPVTNPPDAPTGALYSTLPAPVRVAETRSSAPGGCVGPRCGALGTGQSFTFDARALAAVPDDATAVVLNVTAVATTQTGFLTLYPTGSTRPTASSLNFSPGQTLANHVTATLGSDGRFNLYNHFGTTHVVIDLVGYYAPSSSQGLMAITPVRALETRPDVPSGCLPAGLHCTPFTTGETLGFAVRGATFQGTEIPTEATAVVLNVTAVQPAANGFLTVWPGGTARPTASSLNFSTGSVVPNLVIAGIGTNDEVNIYNHFGTTDVIVDVLGYFAPGGARYVALDPPTRTMDTRTGNGVNPRPLGGGAEEGLQVGRLNGVPIDAVAALFNLTVAGPAGSGFLTVWPFGDDRPTSSNLNFGPGAVVSNGVLTALGSGGLIGLYNHFSSPSTPALADLSGYFVSG